MISKQKLARYCIPLVEKKLQRSSEEATWLGTVVQVHPNWTGFPLKGKIVYLRIACRLELLRMLISFIK